MGKGGKGVGRFAPCLCLQDFKSIGAVKGWRFFSFFSLHDSTLSSIWVLRMGFLGGAITFFFSFPFFFLFFFFFFFFEKKSRERRKKKNKAKKQKKDKKQNRKKDQDDVMRSLRGGGEPRLR